MLLDTQNLFSDNQEIQNTQTISQNIIYFSKGDVSNIPFIIQAVSKFSGIKSLEVDIQTDCDSDFENPVSLLKTSLSLDELKEGGRFPVSYLPKGNKGYMRLVYTPVLEQSNNETQTLTIVTIGRITAGVVGSLELSHHEL